MRISDWSTDVRSSDLKADQKPFVKRSAAPRSSGIAAIWPGARRHHVLTTSPPPASRSPYAKRSGLSGSLPFALVSPSLPAETTTRSEEPTSELQSLMRISYAVFCLNKKKAHKTQHLTSNSQ